MLLMAATLLLLTVAYLAQCSPARRAEPAVDVQATRPREARATEGAGEPEAEREGTAPSRRESLSEHDREERAKREIVVHALQTIAANPELRRTYGLQE